MGRWKLQGVQADWDMPMAAILLELSASEVQSTNPRPMKRALRRYYPWVLQVVLQAGAAGLGPGEASIPRGSQV